MTDIPITANERKAQFTGNTGLGPFAFTFNILETGDLRVIKNSTVLTIVSEYTVTTNADGTGSVTLTGSGNGAALVPSDLLTIIGNRQLARTSDYVQGGNLFAEALNEDFDSVVIMMQQLDEKVSRTMRIDAGDVAQNLLLPEQSTRASKYLAFDVNGDPVATSGTSNAFIVSAYAETFLGVDSASEFFDTLEVTSYAQSLFDDADAAAARATLGLGNIATTDLIDEDDMSSDSAARAPTQQSVKSYVDTSVATTPNSFRFISSIDVSATASATFILDSTLYDAYEFVISNLIPTADNSALMLRTSSDGGSTYANGASDYSYAGSYVAAADAGTLRTAAADNLAIAANVGNAAGEDGYSGTVRVFGPHLARKTLIRADGAYYLNSGAFFSMVLAGERKSTSPVDAIQIFYGATTMASGTITLYGLRNA